MTSNTAASKNQRLANLLRAAPVVAQCHQLAATAEGKKEVSILLGKDAASYIPFTHTLLQIEVTVTGIRPYNYLVALF